MLKTYHDAAEAQSLAFLFVQLQPVDRQRSHQNGKEGGY